MTSLEIKKGQHTLSLENQSGFNAINTFAFWPQEKIETWQRQAKEILAVKKKVYFYQPGEATKSSGLNVGSAGKYEVLIQIPSQVNTDKIRLKIDEQVLEKVFKPENAFGEWLTLGEVDLKDGTNKLEVLAPSKFEEIIFFQKEEKNFEEILTKHDNLPTITTKFLNPTKYLLQVKNNQTPFNLVFAETYHPDWKATVNGQTFKSSPFYSIMNGFGIDKLGDFEVLVEFSPQKMMLPGLAISLSVLTLTILALMYLFFKK